MPCVLADGIIRHADELVLHQRHVVLQHLEGRWCLGRLDRAPLVDLLVPPITMPPRARAAARDSSTSRPRERARVSCVSSSNERPMPAEEARTARRMKPWNMSILALRTITVLPGVSTSICSVPRVYVWACVRASGRSGGHAGLPSRVSRARVEGRRARRTIACREDDGAGMIADDDLSDADPRTIGACLLDHDAAANDLDHEVVPMRSRLQLRHRDDCNDPR